MPISATGSKLDPPRDGEGDHAKHGGGGSPLALRSSSRPSTALRAVPLPVPGRIETGFTLIELLVVLAIIGMLSAAVVLAIPDPRGSLTAEAERFAARAEAAQDRAILDARALSVRVTSSGYGFDRRERTGWQPIGEEPFEPQSWREGTVASGPGRILFDPTGLAEPGSLTLTREDEQVTVEFAHDGAIHVRA